jgi:predicted lipid carrier protein YhbT
MMHGAEDGDALFFSRDLAVEGDTAAVLALRNAMDDAELDLTEELAALSGPLAAPLRRALARAERSTGLALHRVDMAEGWT